MLPRLPSPDDNRLRPEKRRGVPPVVADRAVESTSIVSDAVGLSRPTGVKLEVKVEFGKQMIARCCESSLLFEGSPTDFEFSDLEGIYTLKGRSIVGVRLSKSTREGKHTPRIQNIVPSAAEVFSIYVVRTNTHTHTHTHKSYLILPHVNS